MDHTIIRSLLELERLSSSLVNGTIEISSLSIRISLPGKWDVLDLCLHDIVSSKARSAPLAVKNPHSAQHAIRSAWCRRVRHGVASILVHAESLKFLEFIIPDYITPLDYFPEQVTLPNLIVFSLQWRVTLMVANIIGFTEILTYVRRHGSMPDIQPYFKSFALSIENFLRAVPTVTTLRMSLPKDNELHTSLPAGINEFYSPFVRLVIDTSLGNSKILPALSALDITGLTAMHLALPYVTLTAEILPYHSSVRILIIDGGRHLTEAWDPGCGAADYDSEDETHVASVVPATSNGYDWVAFGRFLWKNKLLINLKAICTAGMTYDNSPNRTRLDIKHGALLEQGYSQTDCEALYTSETRGIIADDGLDIIVCDTWPNYDPRDAETLRGPRERRSNLQIQTMEHHKPGCGHSLAYGSGPYPADIWSFSA